MYKAEPSRTRVNDRNHKVGPNRTGAKDRNHNWYDISTLLIYYMEYPTYIPSKHKISALMLVKRRRRWANIKAALAKRLKFSGFGSFIAAITSLENETKLYFWHRGKNLF